ncbi:GtrA family protein [Cellvibrio sp. ARAG 10.3]|uniref:GtrA family protein n=1 Tax=Cellvibrio sp. ARAG 10.3 TaxID=3451358 RepID=UPI003F44CE12
MVGGSATLLQFVLLFLLVEFSHLNEVLASALSFALSAIYNYLMNYYFTFASEKSHIETAMKFMLVAALGLAINSSTFALFLSLGLYYLLAQVGATIITLFVNFLLHKIWIYRS